ILLFFFFSSRRRHTRSTRDWSSDVCSSDLYEVEVYPDPQAPPKKLIIEKVKSGIDGLITTLRDPIDAEVFAAGDSTLKVVAQFEIGRASCREGGEMADVTGWV